MFVSRNTHYECNKDVYTFRHKYNHGKSSPTYDYLSIYLCVYSVDHKLLAKKLIVYKSYIYIYIYIYICVCVCVCVCLCIYTGFNINNPLEFMCHKTQLNESQIE